MIKRSEKIANVGCVFKIESASKEAVCPRCGKRSQIVHQNHWHLVRDLPICGQDTYLKANRRQWKCREEYFLIGIFNKDPKISIRLSKEDILRPKLRNFCK